MQQLQQLGAGDFDLNHSTGEPTNDGCVGVGGQLAPGFTGMSFPSHWNQATPQATAIPPVGSLGVGGVGVGGVGGLPETTGAPIAEPSFALLSPPVQPPVLPLVLPDSGSTIDITSPVSIASSTALPDTNGQPLSVKTETIQTIETIELGDSSSDEEAEASTAAVAAQPSRPLPSFIQQRPPLPARAPGVTHPSLSGQPAGQTLMGRPRPPPTTMATAVDMGDAELIEDSDDEMDRVLVDVTKEKATFIDDAVNVPNADGRVQINILKPVCDVDCGR